MTRIVFAEHFDESCLGDVSVFHQPGVVLGDGIVDRFQILDWPIGLGRDVKCALRQGIDALDLPEAGIAFEERSLACLVGDDEWNQSVFPLEVDEHCL